MAELKQILAAIENKVDVAVLGCTHFPLIKQEIQAVLTERVLLVDSGEAIARRVEDLLETTGEKEKRGKREIFSTAPPWEDIYDNFPVAKDGKVAIPDEPGWGIRVRQDWLESAQKTLFKSFY